MFPVEGLQDFSAAKSLKTTLNIIVVPFQRLRPQKPKHRNTNTEGGF